MIVESTPTHSAVGWPLRVLVVLRASELYGSGWIKNRYQLSICDSMPQPKTPAPETRLLKSPSSVPGVIGSPAVPMGGAGGVGAPFVPMPLTCGYQYKNPDEASATVPSIRAGAVPVKERSRRCAWSSMWAL